MLSKDQFREVHGLLASDGGFTVNPRTGDRPSAGYSVASEGNEHRVPIESSGPDDIEKYAHANEDRFGGMNRQHLGGWRSQHDDVLDTPSVYPATPSGESRARRAMVMQRQEAGFYLGSFKEMRNPFHPTDRANHGEPPHELADAALKNPHYAIAQPEVKAWVKAPVGRAQATRKG